MKERCIWDAGKVRALEWEENERREDKEFKGRKDGREGRWMTRSVEGEER